MRGMMAGRLWEPRFIQKIRDKDEDCEEEDGWKIVGAKGRFSWMKSTETLAPTVHAQVRLLWALELK